jgi:hypothetical protein
MRGISDVLAQIDLSSSGSRTGLSPDGAVNPPAALQGGGSSRFQVAGAPSLVEVAGNHGVEQVSLTPFTVRVALRPLIQNSMSASA